MVHYGKRSGGCGQCKIRRVKCDEARPGCSQCRRILRRCPGYRDIHSMQAPTDIIIEAKSRNARTRVSLLPNPRPHLEDVAQCFFVANYVLVSRIDDIPGFSDFVIHFTKCRPRPHFQYAFEACAAASWSISAHAGPLEPGDLERRAVSLYTKALAATHVALRETTTMEHDSTLASVILLSLFENMTAKRFGSTRWASHIAGAMQICILRGTKKLSTKLGRDLLTAVKCQLVAQVFYRCEAPPVNMAWFLNNACHDIDSRCEQLNLRAAKLQLDAHDLIGRTIAGLHDASPVLRLLQQCQMLEKEFMNHAKTLPKVFYWTTIAWKPRVPRDDCSEDDVFPGYIDVYNDLSIGRIWNSMRCARLMLSSTIMRLAARLQHPASYRTTPEYADAARTCTKLIADIIASVPSLSGAPVFLLWPLTCLLWQDYLSASQRAWTKRRLGCIGTKLGIKFANSFAQSTVRIPSMQIERDLQGQAHFWVLSEAGGFTVQPGK